MSGDSPSPAAMAVAEVIRRSARAGALRRPDVEAVAEALQEAGVVVELPPAPRTRGAPGWLVVVRRRCSSPGCGCRTDPARRHGPYVLHRRRVAGRVRERCLGRLGEARAPEGLEEELEALQPAAPARLPAGVLHDD